MKDLRQWIANEVIRAAAGRMRRRHPDWADAMLSEHETLDSHADQLGWALGSLRAGLALEDVVYPAVLALGLIAMTLYQWSADESLISLLLLAGLSLVLGFLRPSRFLVSGIAIGLVIATVNAFETASGIRPAYEVHPHGWAHDLRWLLLVAPAVLSSALGRQIGRNILA
jgi:hypothetical protein